MQIHAVLLHAGPCEWRYFPGWEVCIVCVASSWALLHVGFPFPQSSSNAPHATRRSNLKRCMYGLGAHPSIPEQAKLRSILAAG